MGITSDLTTAQDGSTYRIILLIAADTSGSTATVNAEITWTTSELGNGANAFPSNGITTPGKVTWSNVTVDHEGTAFTIDLTCQSSGTHRVDGKATEQGQTPQTHRRSVACA